MGQRKAGETGNVLLLWENKENNTVKEWGEERTLTNGIEENSKRYSEESYFFLSAFHIPCLHMLSTFGRW